MAAASVSALSLFPAACSTAVLCYHPPRAFFFRYHSSANLTAVRPVVAASAACCCCCLLLAASAAPLLSHSHSLLLLFLAPLASRVRACLLAGGFYSPLLLSATTNIATTSNLPHTPPPITYSKRSRHRLANFRRVASLSLLPPNLLSSRKSSLVCYSVRTGR